MSRRALVCAVAAGVLGLGCGPCSGRSNGRDVVAIARGYRDGGGYKWEGHGVPEDVAFKGAVILSKARSPTGTYCCGFTFAVAMKAAVRRGLLADKTVAQVRRLQREWFGASSEPTVKSKQCAVAVEHLGIGKEIPLAQARPGDFLMIWRTNGSGHSVVFLRWATRDGERIGIGYRSSQPKTRGIGDNVEYFAGVQGTTGAIDPRRAYACRLRAK